MKYICYLPILVAIVLTGCATTTIIDFENLSSVTKSSLIPTPVNPGDKFYVGDVLIEQQSGVEIVVLPFQWPDKTTWTNGGFVEIVPGNKAGGFGNEIHFNNACVGIITPTATTIKKINLKFGDYGGNINLIGNGCLENESDFALITSPTPCGLSLLVTPGGPSQGSIQISGTINMFYYFFPVPPNFPIHKYSAVLGGGQELWIDDIEFFQ